jgi:hypothetical protein
MLRKVDTGFPSRSIGNGQIMIWINLDEAMRRANALHRQVLT